MSLSAKPCQHMVPQRHTRGPELDQIRLRIADCHWQIESEFSRTNTRDIIVDLSELVMGSTSHQLFTTSHRHGRNEDVLEACSEPAACCGASCISPSLIIPPIGDAYLLLRARLCISGSPVTGSCCSRQQRHRRENKPGGACASWETSRQKHRSKKRRRIHALQHNLRPASSARSAPAR